MQRFSVKGLTTTLGRALRSARYAVGDVLFVAGRIPRAIGRGAETAWGSMPTLVRQRLAAALAFLAAVALLALVVVPNLPCAFPAGETCAPDDDAVELVPGDALAYLHVNLDRETEQYEQAVDVLERVPGLTRGVAEQLQPQFIGAAGQASSFERDIRPWFGGEVAIAVLAGRGSQAEQVQLIEIEDAEGARAYAETIAAGTPTVEPYREVDVSVDERGLATAILADFLVVGRAAAVRDVIDVQGAEGVGSLADDPVAVSARERLPDKRVLDALLSEDGLAAFVAEPKALLAPFEPLFDARGSQAAAAALVATDEGFELATRSVLDPERTASRPGFFSAFPAFDPSLAEGLSEETIAYLGLGDPRATFGKLLEQATTQAPSIARGFTDLVRELRREGGVDLQRDLLPALRGEAAFSVVSRPAPPGGEAEAPPEQIPGLPPSPQTLAPGADATPYLQLLATEIDAEAAREALARLQGPLARSLDVQLAAPNFEPRQLGGVEAQVLRISPTAELAYAVFGSTLVAATDPAGVERTASGEGESLADSKRFESVTSELAESPALLAYLDLRELLGFGEAGVFGEDTDFASFAPDLRRLEGFGFAVTSAPDALDSDSRLTISAEAPAPGEEEGG